MGFGRVKVGGGDLDKKTTTKSTKGTKKEGWMHRGRGFFYLCVLCALCGCYSLWHRPTHAVSPRSFVSYSPMMWSGTPRVFMADSIHFRSLGACRPALSRSV